MFRKTTKKIYVVVLALAVFFSNVNSDFSVNAEDGDTSETITITPMKGLWKYYGQTKTFVQDEHYFVSPEDAKLPEGYRLDIASEEVGKQKYIIKTENQSESASGSSITASGSGIETAASGSGIETAASGQSIQTTPEKFNVQIAENAPEFEVRKYVAGANVVVKEQTKVYASKNSIEIEAPEGYLISRGNKPDSDWADSLETGELEEGENPITYYLRSNLYDNTRKAIDQTPKKTIIKVDTIAPKITQLRCDDDITDVTAEGSIIGNEPGMYYYMLVPDLSSEDDELEDDAAENDEPVEAVTADEVLKTVTSGHGIVGYGRLDADKETELSFKGMTPLTKYIVYAVLVDAAGNKSTVATAEFKTDKMVIDGEVDVTGDVKVGATLTAKPIINSPDTGDLSYQWFRVKLTGDEPALNEVVDETGGEKEDDLEADDEDDDEDYEDDDDDEIELLSVQKMAEDEDDITTTDGATPIEGATSNTYKITKADIGSRLIVRVTAENYSSYVAGSTTTFVPKLMPTYKLPVIAGAVYSPTRRLSAIKLPAQWSWVDSSIVPVYGNSGYRARFTPADTAVYKTVILRVKVPVYKKALKRSMITVPKKVAYTGKAIKNNVKVKDSGKKLTSGRDYKLSYANNKKLGKATVKVKGVGNYKGTVKVTYRIKKKSVKKVTCKYKKVKAFKNKKVTAGLVLKNGKVKMKKKRDYTVQYKNNKEIGRAKIIIRGKGNYKGKRVLRFSIVPSKPKIKKVKKKKTSFQLTLSSKWKIKGYQVYVSTARSFSKSKTQKYITTGKRFGVYGLTRKTTYYVRVKTYQTKKGKSYESAYSSVKKIKIK